MITTAATDSVFILNIYCYGCEFIWNDLLKFIHLSNKTQLKLLSSFNNPSLSLEEKKRLISMTNFMNATPIVIK